jgi:hypothetical protein
MKSVKKGKNACNELDHRHKALSGRISDLLASNSSHFVKNESVA